jgi:hypothetical protein
VAQASHLDPQARAVGGVRPAGAERMRDQLVALGFAGPRLRQTPQQREQHRPAGELHHTLCQARGPPAAVDDQVR